MSHAESVGIEIKRTAWDTAGDVLVRGDVFADGEYVGTDIGQRFEGVTDPLAIRERVTALGGQFALIVETPRAVHAAVDHVGSVPLYYGVGDGRVYVGDDAASIQTKIPTDGCDTDASAEFLLTSYVTGNDTLFPRLKQLQPGQLLSIPRGQPADRTIRQHFSFTDPEVVSADRLVVLDRLDTTLKNAFERLATRAAGEPLLVALSGGYDSRLVALMLDLVGYDNVYTFTFPDFLTEGDMARAREIATALGYEWVPIEMTRDDFRTFSRSEEYARLKRDLDDFATVTPYLFWMLVLKKVQASSDLPDSGIVLTGHGVAGSTGHLPEVADGDHDAKLDTAIDWVWDHHYHMRHLDDPTLRETMRERIQTRLRPVADGDATAVQNAIISWYWQERVPKFLARHVDSYRYWGYDRWLPLWDRELARFWGSIPIEYRRGKAIYQEYIDRVTESELGRRYGTAGGDGSDGSTTDAVSVLETVVSRFPGETAVRSLYRRWQTREVKHSPTYRRYGFLTAEQFDELYPNARHPKYFHALEKVSRLRCRPPAGTPLADHLDVYEKYDTTTAPFGRQTA